MAIRASKVKPKEKKIEKTKTQHSVKIIYLALYIKKKKKTRIVHSTIKSTLFKEL